MYIILTSIILECLIPVDYFGLWWQPSLHAFNCVCSQSLKLYGSTFKLRLKVQREFTAFASARNPITHLEL